MVLNLEARSGLESVQCPVSQWQRAGTVLQLKIASWLIPSQCCTVGEELTTETTEKQGENKAKTGLKKNFRGKKVKGCLAL